MVDEHRATATLRVNGRSVTATFEFGPDDLPVTCAAERFFDSGGQSVLTPWVGFEVRSTSVPSTMSWAPHHVVAAWVVNGKPSEYVRFDVERVMFDGDGLS